MLHSALRQPGCNTEVAGLYRSTGIYGTFKRRSGIGMHGRKYM